MKNTLLIFAIFLGMTVFGQEERAQIEVSELKVLPLQIQYKPERQETSGSDETSYAQITSCSGNGFRSIGSRFADSEAILYWRSQVIQPTETNELPNGTMPLSKDLPYVHTLRGYTYTADYLRYTPRY